MILLWLKITYYKIIKVLKRAEAGTEPHVRARVTRAETTSPEVLPDVVVGIDPATGNADGLILYARRNGKVTTSTVRLRRLIELGLVHESDGLGDLQRVEQWREDWAAREAGDPSACPCGGRHYPEPDACRWCRCHDPRSKHHAAPSVGIMQVIKPELTGRMLFEEDHANPPPFEPEKLMAVRPSAEIVLCPRCPHADHGGSGGRCTGSVPSWEPSGGIELCRCGQDEEQA